MSSNDTSPAGFKPKNSVALSGATAGNTALCTVGRSGNDLHYRGYDILDLAEKCEFEEVAHLLVHGKLPNAAELKGYKTKLMRLRGLPESVQMALQALPAASHPMDVMRTGTSVLGCTLPEKDDHNSAGARDIADRLLASLGSMLCYWYHYSHSGRIIDAVRSERLRILRGQIADGCRRAAHQGRQRRIRHAVGIGQALVDEVQRTRGGIEVVEILGQAGREAAPRPRARPARPSTCAG